MTESFPNNSSPISTVKEDNNSKADPQAGGSLKGNRKSSQSKQILQDGLKQQTIPFPNQNATQQNLKTEIKGETALIAQHMVTYPHTQSKFIPPRPFDQRFPPIVRSTIQLLQQQELQNQMKNQPQKIEQPLKQQPQSPDVSKDVSNTVKQQLQDFPQDSSVINSSESNESEQSEDSEQSDICLDNSGNESNQSKPAAKRAGKKSDLSLFLRHWFSSPQGYERPQITQQQLDQLKFERFFLKQYTLKQISKKITDYRYKRVKSKDPIKALSKRRVRKYKQKSQQRKQIPEDKQEWKEDWMCPFQTTVLEKLHRGGLHNAELGCMKLLFKEMHEGRQINDVVSLKRLYIEREPAVNDYLGTYLDPNTSRHLIYPPFSSIPTKLKIEAWLNNALNIVQLRANVKIVANELRHLLNIAEYHELENLQYSVDSQDLVCFLLNQDSFGNVYEYDGKVLFFLAEVQLLRKCCMDSILPKEKRSNQMLNILDPQGHQGKQLRKQIRSVLIKVYNFENVAAQTIVDDPKQLLWETSLTIIRQLDCRNHFLKIWSKLKLGYNDPLNMIQELIEALSLISHSIKTLSEFEADNLGSHRNIIDFCEYACKRPRLEVEATLSKGSIQNFLRQSSEQTMGSQHIDEQELKRNNQGAKDLAIQSGLIDKYNWLWNISQQWSTSSNQVYTNHGMLVYYAIKSGVNKSNVVGVQLDPGNGKSYLMLLTATFVMHFYKKKVVISSLNKALVRQLQEKRDLVKARNLIIVNLEYLKEYIGDQDVVFFIDELHWGLVNTKYILNSLNQPPIIFHLGLQNQMYFYTGHTSQEFSKFCKSHYQGFTHYEFRKVLCKELDNQRQDFDVVCCADENDLHEKAELHILKQSTTSPVITFGLEKITNNLKGSANNVQILECSTMEESIVVANTALRLNKGIVQLSDQFACGFDCKFKQGAQVIIGALKTPKLEEIYQMLGRGARHLNSYKGTLFIVTSSQDAQAVKHNILTQDAHDFKDGSQIIKAIKKKLDQPKATAAAKKITAALSGNPWQDGAVVVDLMTGVYNKYMANELK